MTSPVNVTSGTPHNASLDEQIPLAAATAPLTPEDNTDGWLPAAVNQLVEGHHLGRNSNQSPSEPSKSLQWYAMKAASETACLALPCSEALLASQLLMPDAGLAEKMLRHFVSGSSQPVSVDLNAEIERNPQLKEFVASNIESEVAQRFSDGEDIKSMSGAIWVSQNDYGSSRAGRDQQLALGGTFFEYQIVGSSDCGGLQVQLSIADHYFWSPSEESRPTQCLHKCGADLVRAGKSTEFHQFGEGLLAIGDPRTNPTPMLPLLSPPGAAL